MFLEWQQQIQTTICNYKIYELSPFIQQLKKKKLKRIYFFMFPEKRG